MLAFDPPGINIDLAAIRRALDNPKTDAVLYAQCVKMKGIAIAVFVSQDRVTKHGVTPPPYLASFRIDKVRGKFRLTNDDPAAFWVEFGAYNHDAGHARILKYKPLSRAIDALGAGDG